MQIPDRSVAPEKRDIRHIQFPEVQKHLLDNNVPVHILNLGTQDVVKLELIFKAGRPFESKKLVSRVTGKILKEGTANKTALQIAEEVDFYGGTLSIPVNLDTSNIVLYSLKKHYERLLSIIAEIISEPAFPEEEIQTFINNSKHQLAVDLSKNEVVAFRKVTEFIFGQDHPYGYNSEDSLYDALTREDLVNHFEKTFTRQNCQIVLSGKVDNTIIDLTNKYLGSLLPEGQVSPSIFTLQKQQPQKIKIERPGSVQTAIRLGRHAIPRQHMDYNGLYILSTVLGGYFGSRLMTNIREDKGYTYHVFSTLETMLFDGYFNIGTEVGNDFVNATLDQIYFEIKKLKQEPLDKEELKMVRNYLLGYLLNAVDGPFNAADVFKSLLLEGLDIEDFYALVETIHMIEPSQLQALANKYLKEDEFWQVVVGK